MGGPDSNGPPHLKPNPMYQWEASKTNVSQAQIDFESVCENIAAEEQMQISKANSVETVFDTQMEPAPDLDPPPFPDPTTRPVRPRAPGDEDSSVPQEKKAEVGKLNPSL